MIFPFLECCEEEGEDGEGEEQEEPRSSSNREICGLQSLN